MLSQYALLLGRLILGWFFITAGINHFKNLSMMSGYAASKKIPMPKFGVAFTGLILILGGLGVLFGVWVNYALDLLVIFLVPTTFMFHDYWNDVEPTAKMNNRINFRKNLALLGAVLAMYAIATPWAFSLIK